MTFKLIVRTKNKFWYEQNLPTVKEAQIKTEAPNVDVLHSSISSQCLDAKLTSLSNFSNYSNDSSGTEKGSSDELLKPLFSATTKEGTYVSLSAIAI